MRQASSLESAQVFSGFRQSATVTKYEIVDHFGSLRFFILLGVYAAASFAFTILSSLHRATTPLAFYSGWLGSGGGISIELYIIALGAILFGGDAICGEFQNRTGYFTMTNPVSRSSIYFGKFLASFVCTLLALSVFIFASLGNAVYYFGLAAFPPQLSESILLSLLYLTSTIGLLYLLSSLFGSSVNSTIFAAFFLFFGFVLVQDFVSLVAEPWFLLSYGSQVVSGVLLVPYPFHMVSGGTNTITGGNMIQYYPTALEGTLIMLGYLVLTTVLGLFVFERREFS